MSLVHIFDYVCPQFTLAQYLTCAGELSASCYGGFISWKGDRDTEWISSIRHMCLVRIVVLFVFQTLYHSVYIAT